MDALTPRSRQAAMETASADQVTPRSARSGADEAVAAALRKESVLAAARASPRAPSPSAFGAASLQAINLKQLAARAASPLGSPRGAASAAATSAPHSHRSPRQGDQTARRAAAPAALSGDDGSATGDDGSDDGEPGMGGPQAELAAQAPAAARAQPALHIDVPPGGPLAPPVAPARLSGGDDEAQTPLGTAASLGFWRTRSSNLPPTLSLPRRLTGPGGLTAAEILLMDARRPSRADDEADLHHWVHAGHSSGGAAVEAIKEESAVAGLPADDLAPVGGGRRGLHV